MKRDRQKRFWVEIPPSIIPLLWAAAATSGRTPDQLIYSGTQIICALTLEKKPLKPQTRKPPERTTNPCHVGQLARKIASKFDSTKPKKTS